MRFVADLHIHSHYSISTSRELVPEQLDLAARRKGITVVGTGDVTHPGWRAELEEKLEPAEQGLYRLRSPAAAGTRDGDAPVRFLLTAEISGIYRFDGKVRKVHSLVLLPDIAAAERLALALGRIGNLAADGRPVLALDARDLLEILLQSSPEGMLIPAHIWTPWFSVLGSRSGFDSIPECFRDLSGHIHAVETGLSSDPAMNWMCGALDAYTLVSNSDAHSPDKLAREANLLDTELSYPAITGALRGGQAAGFCGTIEFFPEEGKYHLDGHRACGVRQEPEVTRAAGGRCPVCGKELTEGVLHRVLDLADHPDGRRPAGALPFSSLIPLREILAQIAGTGAQSKAVSAAYAAVIEACGTELDVLLHLPVPEVERRAGELVAEAVRRMRARDVVAEAGYDGEYGTISLFRPGEIQERYQAFLLPGVARPGREPRRRIPRGPNAPARDPRQPELLRDAPGTALLRASFDLTPEQREAATHGRGPALVIAGPGTGKTRTLTWRVGHLVRDLGVEPESILVVTFTNRAAGEIRERLASLLGDTVARRLRAGTFHAFGLSVLAQHAEQWGRTPAFALYDEQDRGGVLAELAHAAGLPAAQAAAAIGALKRRARPAAPMEQDLLEAYEAALRAANAFDLDDLVCLPAGILGSTSHGVEWLLVDELQDIDAVQYAMVRALAPKPDSSLFAIGDPDQAIYAFRGGDASLARRLLMDYPAARTYSLLTSYRCPRTFLRASSRVLRGAGGRPLAGVEEGVRVRVVTAPTERSEAELIARSIEEMMGGMRFFAMDSAVSQGVGAPDVRGLGDFAVLVRMARLAEPIRAALDDHAIPYALAGERSFLAEEPCRSVLALLALAANPQDASAFRRLAGHARLPAGGDVRAAAAQLRAADGVTGRIARAAELLRAEGRVELAAIRRLAEMSKPFSGDLAGFLRLARLGSPGDGVVPGAERVAVMTLHAAKGLEFPCVFVAACEDGIVPLELEALGRAADLEEERRLLYVGMTRASRMLVLTHARRRRLFGRTLALPRSRFLDDLDEEDFEETAQEVPRRRGHAEPQLELDL